MPSSQRDNLLEHIRGQLDGVQSTLNLLGERMAKVESGNDQRQAEAQRFFNETWPRHLEEEKQDREKIRELIAAEIRAVNTLIAAEKMRTDGLVAVQQRAEGAAWAVKLLWLLLPAMLGAGGTYLATRSADRASQVQVQAATPLGH